MVFSIDSVITAVGMTPFVGVMIAAVTVSIGMLFASKGIYAFVNRHPTVKMLALSFLLLIGVTLVAEGLGQKIPKGYVYAAIAFSVLVEMLNIRLRRQPAAPVSSTRRRGPSPAPSDAAHHRRRLAALPGSTWVATAAMGRDL